jgi:hypothetical protein
LKLCQGVTAKGMARMLAHLSRPELQALDDPLNRIMVERLQNGKRAPEDLSFYLHELKESALMDRGMASREAHLATLRWQAIGYVRGYEVHLYSPEAYALLNPDN